MTQVSGSISLEMGKVVRETVRDTLAALLAPPLPEDERATPLEQVAEAVTGAVVQRLDRIMVEVGALSDQVEELTGMVRAEAERAGRMQATSLEVLGPDGQPLYVIGTEVQGGGGGAPGGGQSAVGVGTRAREASEESGHALDVAAGSDPLAIPPNRVDDPDERLAQARRDGADDSWYEEPA